MDVDVFRIPQHIVVLGMVDAVAHESHVIVGLQELAEKHGAVLQDGIRPDKFLTVLVQLLYPERGIILGALFRGLPGIDHVSPIEFDKIMIRPSEGPALLRCRLLVLELQGVEHALFGFFIHGIAQNPPPDQILRDPRLNDGERLLVEMLAVSPLDELEPHVSLSCEKSAVVCADRTAEDLHDIAFQLRERHLDLMGKNILEDTDAVLEAVQIAQGDSGVNIPHSKEELLHLFIFNVTALPVILDLVHLSIADEGIDPREEKIQVIPLHLLVVDGADEPPGIIVGCDELPDPEPPVDVIGHKGQEADHGEAVGAVGSLHIHVEIDPVRIRKLEHTENSQHVLHRHGLFLISCQRDKAHPDLAVGLQRMQLQDRIQMEIAVLADPDGILLRKALPQALRHKLSQPDLKLLTAGKVIKDTVFPEIVFPFRAHLIAERIINGLQLCLPFLRKALKGILSLNVKVLQELGNPVAEEAIFRKIFDSLRIVVGEAQKPDGLHRRLRFIGGARPQDNDRIQLLLGEDILCPRLRNAQAVAVADPVFRLVVEISIGCAGYVICSKAGQHDIDFFHK